MHTYNSLLQQLDKLQIDPKGTLLVHSSMKAIGAVAGEADTVLDALCTYMQDGLLVLPTHTWDTVNKEQPVYDPTTAKSCVGILTNLFLSRPHVVRSLHPTHSVAALGKGAKGFVAGEEQSTTPCPRTGCWGRLYQEHATILFIGCALNRNTFIHSVEEWSNIQDRLSTWTQPLIIRQKQREYTVDMHRHCCSFTDDVSQHYSKLTPALAAMGALHTGHFGDASCLVCDAVKMGDITTAFLQRNPALFADTAPIPQDWYTA